MNQTIWRSKSEKNLNRLCVPREDLTVVEQLHITEKKCSLFALIKYENRTPNILFSKYGNVWYKYNLHSLDMIVEMVNLNINDYTELILNFGMVVVSVKLFEAPFSYKLLFFLNYLSLKKSEKSHRLRIYVIIIRFIPHVIHYLLSHLLSKSNDGCIDHSCKLLFF